MEELLAECVDGPADLPDSVLMASYRAGLRQAVTLDTMSFMFDLWCIAYRHQQLRHRHSG